MFGYYKKQIIEITKLIRKLEEDESDYDLLIEIQFDLLKKITHAERKINGKKVMLKEQRGKLRKSRLSKFDSAKQKKLIDRVENRIKDYELLIYVWKCFGDAIAFIYLDKWAIKPLMYQTDTAGEKQSSGQIHGKSGLRSELAVVVDAVSNSVPALLNDLTNTIRHGDVCLLGESDPFIIEVKSSKNENKRTKRQVENISKIQNYLETDKGENIRGASDLRRVATSIDEINYQKELNEQISKAIEYGQSSGTPEEGILHLVHLTSIKPDLESHFAPIRNGLLFFFNSQKNEKHWGHAYPFTLLIRDPLHLYSFIAGEIYIMAAIDLAVIGKIAESRDIRFQYSENDEWAFHFEKDIEGLEDPLAWNVAHQFVDRLALECLSIEWMFDNDEAMTVWALEQIDEQKV